MKESLQKKLLTQQIKFKEEQKKFKKVQRQQEKEAMKESGQDAYKNIILPRYQKNQELGVYVEVEKPPKAIYKAVGYNDMNRIKIIMEGDDAEKRDESFVKSHTKT